MHHGRLRSTLRCRGFTRVVREIVVIGPWCDDSPTSSAYRWRQHLRRHYDQTAVLARLITWIAPPRTVGSSAPKGPADVEDRDRHECGEMTGAHSGA